MGRFLLVLCLVLSISQAQTLEDLRHQLTEENYDEVVQLVESIPPEERSVDVLEIYAEALIGTGSFKKAEKVCRSILSIESNREKTKLILAEALVGEGNYGEALKILKTLKESDGKNYLLGLVYFKKGKFVTARSYFKKVSPEFKRYRESLLYSAISYIGENRQNKAMPIIKKLKDTPYSELLKDHMETSSRLRFGLRLGLEYDSNVNISPETLPKESSVRTYGAFHLNRDSERLSMNLNAYAGFNRDVPSYDTSTLKGSLKLRGVNFFIPVGFSYTLVGRDFYSAEVFGGLGIEGERLSLSVEGGYRNFREFELPEENRDGTFGRVRFGGYLLDGNEVFLTGGYYLTKGDNWKRYELGAEGRHSTSLGFLSLGLSWRIVYSPYLKDHSVFGKKRKDTFIAILPYVGVRVFSNGYIIGNYSLYRNSSNIEIYDYTRHVAGVSFYYGF